MPSTLGRRVRPKKLHVESTAQTSYNDPRNNRQDPHLQSHDDLSHENVYRAGAENEPRRRRIPRHQTGVEDVKRDINRTLLREAATLERTAQMLKDAIRAALKKRWATFHASMVLHLTLRRRRRPM
jgi:hypothetical protein